MLGFGHLDFRGTFNKRLTTAVLLITISQFNFGFDQQGFAATQAMTAFDKQFGHWDEAKQDYVLDTVWLSFFNGFIYLGQATGVLAGSWISKRYGRRMCMFTMSIWALVAATIVITSRTPTQILVARVLNYIYIGMELAVVPVFQSEITPKHARGFVVGTYQISLFSPRWLVLKDRKADALACLQELRVGKYTEEQIEEEYRGIVAVVEQEYQTKTGSFLDIFKPQHRTRTMVVTGANFFLQSTGQIFTSIYGALYVKSLGTINPFTVTVIIAVVSTCTSLLAMVMTDKLGRRFQVLLGASVQVSALMTMGGLGTVSDPSNQIKAGIVSMMVIFTFGYAVGWAPTAHILSAEIPALTVRDMTYRSASVLNIATQFVVSFSLPYLLNKPYAALGSRVGFIFGSISLCSIIFAYFCVPDVSGRSLEEIDHLFASGLSLRKFKGATVQTEPQRRDSKDIESDVVDVGINSNLDTTRNPPRRRPARASPDTCSACRARKVRCDGRRSICTNCERLGFTCSFENPQTNIDKRSTVPVTRRRAHLACFSCHSRKVRCNEEQPTCRRCSRLGNVCVYPTPGRVSDPTHSRSTVALSPGPPSPDSSSDSQSSQARTGSRRRSDGTVQAQTSYALDTRSPPPGQEELELVSNDPADPVQEPIIDKSVEASDSHEPSEQLALKALTIFFTHIRHIPAFSFLHRALVMDQYRSKNFNKALLLSLIGIVSVFHDLGPGMVKRGDEFIARAETLILQDLENPSVPNVQALIFIIKHRAYQRRFTSAFSLTAIAIRYAMGLRLNYDDPKLEFLTQECCRRTMWSLYLIDNVMSAGYQEFTLSLPRLLHIQLPTHDTNFDLDIPEQGGYLEPTHYSPEAKSPSTLSLVIRMMNINYRVLEFTKQAVAPDVGNSEFGSQVDVFQLELNNYQSQLPTQFQSSTRNIQLHAHSSSLSSFLSIHVHWHMAHCNIYRLTMEGLVEALPQPALTALDQEFVRSCQIRCYESAIELAKILQAVLTVKPDGVALDLDIAVSVYQCFRILAHANYTLKIIPENMAEVVKAYGQVCIEFLESMFFECEATTAIVRYNPDFCYSILTCVKKEDAYELMATISMVNISETPRLSIPSPEGHPDVSQKLETRYHVFSRHSLVGQVKVPNKDSSFVTSPSFAKRDSIYKQARSFSPNLSPYSGDSITVENSASSGVDMAGSLSHEVFDFNMLEFNLDSSILFM
ncbi:unnamed protein product [Fusarium graminearum]|nr:unnamed protein product [Fusarium graminearum]